MWLERDVAPIVDDMPLANRRQILVEMFMAIVWVDCRHDWCGLWEREFGVGASTMEF
jgi:hypothetical protein